MGKRLLYLSIYLSIYLSSSSQINLVPNYSFEDTVGNNCFVQMGLNTVNSSTPDIFTKQWYRAKGSPDYYNICANSSTFVPYPNSASIPYNCQTYQNSHTGNSYIGIATYYLLSSDSTNIDSELLGIKLVDTLKKNYCYYSEYYINLSNYSNVATNQVGLFLSQNTYTGNLFYFENNLKPKISWDTTKFFTDTLNWVKVSGYFTAQGGEQYLTIGNFKDGAHIKKQSINTNFSNVCNMGNPNLYNYILIDDVSLYELPNHTGTQSYTLCAGESLLLGDTVSLPVRYQWSLNGVVVDTTKNITVASSASASSSTLTYVLQTKHCTTQTQTITVVVDDGCNPPLVTEALEVPNVFTPNGDGTNDSFEFLILNVEYAKFNVYNRWGNLIKNLELNTKNYISWDGRTSSGIECNAGVYFYVLEYTDASGDVKKKNGYISLIK